MLAKDNLMPPFTNIMLKFSESDSEIKEDKEFNPETNEILPRNLVALSNATLEKSENTCNIVGNLKENVGLNKLTGHILLSHKWGDGDDFATELNIKLQKEGLSTWFDKEQLLCNPNELCDPRLENTGVILLLISENYQETYCCRKEVFDSIFIRNIPAIAIIMQDGLNIHFWLKNLIHSSDFIYFGCPDIFEKNFQDLLKRIKEISNLSCELNVKQCECSEVLKENSHIEENNEILPPNSNVTEILSTKTEEIPEIKTSEEQLSLSSECCKVNNESENAERRISNQNSQTTELRGETQSNSHHRLSQRSRFCEII